VIKAFTRPITRNNTAGLCSYPSNPVSSFNTVTAVVIPAPAVPLAEDVLKGF